MEQYKATSQNTDSNLRALQADIEAVRQKSKALGDRYSSLLQRQHDLVKRHGGVDISDSDQIHLNVGGTKMYALRETLALIKGSRLEVLFSGRWEDKQLRDEEDCVFLDVDPVIFKVILEHLCLMKMESNKRLSWPIMSDEYEQSALDLYLDFLRLNNKTTDDKESSEKISIEMDGKSNVLTALKREKDELDLFEDRLQTLEQKYEEEEVFISFFVVITTVSDDPEEQNSASVTQSKDDEDESRSSEDVISFASMDSDLLSMNGVSSTTSSVANHSQSSPSPNAPNRILKLWIDGDIVYVKHSTMCCIQDSLLAQNFNNASWIKKHSFTNEDGARVILIEHASVFKVIINQLRLQFMVASNDQLPIMKHDHMSLLDSVVSKLFKGDEDRILIAAKNFDSTVIVELKTEQTQVNAWLEEVANVKKHHGPYTLLYRASRDGWEFSDLKRHCANKALLVVIKTTKGYVFGGYSSKSWWGSNQQSYIASSNSFLFSLKCHAGLPPTKMKIKSGYEGHALTNYSNLCGFGNVGNSHNDMVFRDSLKTVYTNIGSAYELPSGSNTGFLTGTTGNTDVAEVEVFQMVYCQNHDYDDDYDY
jgi:hypothetical protein